jgi:hypothetical protein
MKAISYIGKVIEYAMLIVNNRLSFLHKSLLLWVMFSSLPIYELKAVSAIAYDQIPILVMVEGYKEFYVDGIYTNGDLLFVNIQDLFKALNIPCIMGQKGNSLSGFIEKESQTYLIDFDKEQIKVGAKTVNSKSRMLKEMGTIFMESSLFYEAFGISLTFNFRSLSIILKSDFELPVIKQERIEKLRNNMSKLKGEVIADTVVQRNYHLFKFGTMDWLLASTQMKKGATDNRVGIGIGTELLYGEADVSINYYDQYKFDNRQLYYLWRWVDNDKSIIKQAQLGKISNQTIAFINSPMIGAMVRNSPTTIRKATGYYTINEYTEPNWTVELYINDVLVDFTKADATGLFLFKIPIVYGYTTLKLKFYGPLGEERSDERAMNIPYTFMPAKEFEYGLSAGILQDSISNRFGKADFNYGVNRLLTVGGGLEYLSSIPNGAFIPYANATIQPYSKLTITGEYAHGVKTRGLLNLYFMKNAFLEIDYSKYVEGQLVTRFNAPEERKVKLSMPLRYKMISGIAKIDYTQLVYKSFYYNQGNIMLSVYYKQFSANSSTQLNWIGQKIPYVTSDLALSYNLKKGFAIRPSAKYNLSESRLVIYKVAIEKSIPKGYFSATYERNILFNDYLIGLSIKFDLSFARTNATALHSKGNDYYYESAQGSLAFGSGNKNVHHSNNTSVSKGGISIYPFLDLNQNGKFDKGEHKVKLSIVRIMGGKAIYSEKDSIVRIADLNSFTKYIVEFSDNDLDNISWRFKNKTYQVLIDPNQFKRIDIPVVSVGEVSGMVYRNQDHSMKGIGRILIKLYKKNSSKAVAETLSESDGYISYMGLEPGDYVACIDSVQLINLDYTVDPLKREFTIKTLEEGDIIRGIDFVFSDKELKQIPKIDSLPLTSVKKDTAIADMTMPGDENIISSEINNKVNDTIASLSKEQLLSQNNQNIPVWGEICTQPGKYYVQCGAFRYKNNALKLAKYLKQNTDKAVGVVLTNELYKVQVGCVTTRSEANEIKNKIIIKGLYDDSFFRKRE